VAKQFGVDAEDVAHTNKIDDGEPLKVGSLLKLKVRRDLIDDLSASDKDAKEKGTREEKPATKHHKKGHRDAT
jgi:hypothetical protein